MNILWNPNPLATVIELDDFDKKILWHRLMIEDLKERIGSASFTLDPKDREWHNKHVGERTLEAAVTTALGELDVAYILEDEKRGDKHFSEHIDQRLASYVEALSGMHGGDCTCVPCSCLKCHAEALVGVETTAGLEKHAGSYISGAFTPRDKGGPIPTLEDAIISLDDYEPVKGAGWTRDDFEVHIPRWKQEAKEAHDWLVTYKQDHFMVRKT